MTEHDKTLAALKEYYGAATAGAGGLAAKACSCQAAIPPRDQAILVEIDREILDRFYGCGSPIPSCLEGRTVLDLGCGAGRDAYLVSRLVGPSGRVIGVDMTRTAGGGATPSGGAGGALRVCALQRRFPRRPL